MNAPAPLVVLVHGAFTDGSSWAAVIDRLQHAGVNACAAANPLRGLTSDGEYVTGTVCQLRRPTLLVGHDYGGPVITYVGARARNTVGLVFIASVAVAEGETMADVTARHPTPPLALGTDARPYPRPGEARPEELFIRQEAFPVVFAADLSPSRAAVLAVSQRPLAATALHEPLRGPPAWLSLPAWFLVTTQDHAIHPDAQRAAARTMHAVTTVVDASHAVALSQPDTVTVFILKALEALR